MRLAVLEPVQRVQAQPADLVRRERDARERRAGGVAVDVVVVGTDEGDVLRHAQAQRAAGAQGDERVVVVQREQPERLGQPGEPLGRAACHAPAGGVSNLVPNGGSVGHGGPCFTA